MSSILDNRKKYGWEISPYTADNGEYIGKDPREMSVDALNALGFVQTPILKVIRAKCLDCCTHAANEVRKCTACDCQLWPYRMGKNPFRSRETQILTHAQLQARETFIKSRGKRTT